MDRGFRSPLTTTARVSHQTHLQSKHQSRLVDSRPNGLLSGKVAVTWTSSAASCEKRPERVSYTAGYTSRQTYPWCVLFV